MLPTIRVRAVKGALVPFEGDPKRYVGVRRERADREGLDQALVVHRMPGVKLDGAKRASAEVEMVFVTTGPVEVPETHYYVRAVARRELELVGDAKE